MKHKKIWIVSLSLLLALAMIGGGFALYVFDYYHAQTAAIEAFSGRYAVTETAFEGGIAYGEGDEEAALIFYPGGKVEYTAYEPLMRALAAKGILCILVEMPCNLAVLDVHAAEELRARYPGVSDWYIGGHSLGGSMAAAHLGDRHADYRGLLLLGAYSTEDLSGTDLRVLSIYGSEDRVMDREKYEENKKNLPSGFTEKILEGGCHAFFGMYGAQKGDGIPRVEAEEQILWSADRIVAFMKGVAENAQDH